MIGDVLLISEKHKKVASGIIDLIKNLETLSKFTIAIGGESGSGKSEVSHMVAKLLKKREFMPKMLHSDNFYKTPPTERTEWRRKNGIESVGYTEIDWDYIIGIMDDFKNNKKSTMPCIDLLTDQVDELTTDFSNIPILLVDGLYAIKAEVDLSIMIDLTYLETKKAQLSRGKEVLNEERIKILEKEHEVVQSLKTNADFIIDKNFSLVKNTDR